MGMVPNLIAILAQSNACNYCLSAHSMVAKLKGYPEDAILDFRRRKSAQPKERSMIDFPLAQSLLIRYYKVKLFCFRSSFKYP